MENLKTWEEYSAEEKTTLLNHWFYYYGGVVMTLKDVEDFRKLSSSRQDDVFNHIVTSFIFQKTIKSNLLVTCMREEKVDELFSHSIQREMFTDEILEQYEAARRMISEEIFNTFINPEPPVPMDIEILVKDDKHPKKH